MDKISLEQLAEIIQGELFIDDSFNQARDIFVENIAIHSHRIRSLSVFFALKGKRDNGHNYVDLVAENGAVVAVVEKSKEKAYQKNYHSLPLIVVDDTLLALRHLAYWWRLQCKARVVVITGSIGKTTTRNCLNQILSTRQKVYSSPGSYNSMLGVPLAILSCPKEVETALYEVAVSKPGEMELQGRLLQPDFCVITNITERWRNNFSSKHAHISEIISIGQFLNNKNTLLMGIEKLSPEIDSVCSDLSISPHLINDRHSVEYEEKRINASSVELELVDDEISQKIVVNASSELILKDIKIASTTAHMLGVSLKAISKSLEQYVPLSIQTETWKSPTGFTLIREAATLDELSFNTSLELASRYKAESGKMVLVLHYINHLDKTTISEFLNFLSLASVDTVYILGQFAESINQLSLSENIANKLELEQSPERLTQSITDSLGAGDVCLIQANAGEDISKVSTLLTESILPTRMYINLSAVENNITTIRRMIGPNVKIMAMVKALAYGTDSFAISALLNQAGVDYLGVSAVDEGVVLRKSGVTQPILVLLANPADLDKVYRYQLIPVIYSKAMADAVIAFSEIANNTLAIHIELDTGMHRTGLPLSSKEEKEQTKKSIEALIQQPNIEIEGLMTHLSCADDPQKDDFTKTQIKKFEDVSSLLKQNGLSVIEHISASAGTIRFTEARKDMVRIGAAMYGFHPSEYTESLVNLEPAASLVSKLVQVIDVPKGEGVGYGARYIAPEKGGRIGVIPVGYHDCIPRAFSDVGYVSISGKACPIVGAVSMDSMTVDISECPDAVAGTDVVFYGPNAGEQFLIERVAKTVGTIPYELMARVGPRVQRIITRH